MRTVIDNSRKVSRNLGIVELGAAAGGFIVWPAFLFALLQSICVLLGALDGVRLFVGLGALLASSATVTLLDRWHLAWIHLPMIVLAVGGAVLNLVVLWQVRRLRTRPAARWRVTLPGARKLWMERTQFALSIATLVLVAIEESLHLRWIHRF